jgi:hypothetical protein
MSRYAGERLASFSRISSSLNHVRVDLAPILVRRRFSSSSIPLAAFCSLRLTTMGKYGIPPNSITHDSHPSGTQRDNDRSPSRSWTSPFLRAAIGGLALFSDGYNAQVVGYMNPVLTSLYPDDYTSSMKTRMSNAFLIGEVFGMLFFGWAIDRLGRRQGIIWATVFLVLGIVLTTAASGETNEGRFWMMIIGRGVAGFGAGGRLRIAPF